MESELLDMFNSELDSYSDKYNNKHQISSKLNFKYDSYELRDMDGKLIGLCPKKRFDWYLQRGIAEKIGSNAIRLLFEPNMKHPEHNNMKIIKRELVCVVCGSTEKLLKYHTIPHCFKKWFPDKLKSHSSYDVILLCNEHSGDANYIYHEYMKELLDAYKIHDDDFIDKEKQKIKKLAIVLLKKKINKDSIEMRERLNELSNLAGYTVTENDIIKLSNIDITRKINDCSSAAEYIIKHSLESDSELIGKFVLDWKNLFIEDMNPKFLPEDYFYSN